VALKKRERATYAGEEPASRTRRTKETTLFLHLLHLLLLLLLRRPGLGLHLGGGPVQALLLLLRPDGTRLLVLRTVSTRRTCEEHTYGVAESLDTSPHRTYQEGQEVVGVGGSGATTRPPRRIGGSGGGGGGGRHTGQSTRHRDARVPQLQGQLIGGSADLVLGDVALPGCLGQSDQLRHRLPQAARDLSKT
jgi:hypothetical protein